jgi:hypothetical protein
MFRPLSPSTFREGRVEFREAPILSFEAPIVINGDLGKDSTLADQLSKPPHENL